DGDSPGLLSKLFIVGHIKHIPRRPSRDIGYFVGYARMRTGRSWGIVRYAPTTTPLSCISDKADGTEVPLKLSPIGLIKHKSHRRSLGQSIGREKDDESEHYCTLPRICPNEEWRIPVEMYPALRRICPNKEWRTPVDGVPILRRICPNRDVLILEDDLPNHSSNLAIFDPLHILAYLEKLQFIGFMKRRTLNPIAMRQASELIISLADEDAETASHVDTFWKVASEGEDKTD
ncbi:hypothetical protein PSTT_09530, partial [Puccinia striiformis]